MPALDGWPPSTKPPVSRFPFGCPIWRQELCSPPFDRPPPLFYFGPLQQPEELASFERMLFLVEQAWWFYEDFYCDVQATLRRFTLKDFARELFTRCPTLQTYQPHVQVGGGGRGAQGPWGDTHAHIHLSYSYTAVGLHGIRGGDPGFAGGLLRA